ncbi:MAG TPA: hypothetical protein VML19_17830 [Verrucomicrobiae bacterium]|nr:hypothetical protein [Verrucomicrobiae bacterium]
MYKPRAGLLPMATVGPSTPIMLPEYVGRWAFLRALQTQAPGFWLELYALRDDMCAVESWLARNAVVDEWLIGVCCATVEDWNGQQTAQLVPGTRWWRYPLLDQGHVQIPLFAPRFIDPCPSGETGTIEKPAAFEERMRAQFEAQLMEYVRYLRAIVGEDHTQLAKHAAWAALAFTGLSYTKIAGKWRHLRQSGAPDAVIRVSTRRFASRIGLTLPARRA